MEAKTSKRKQNKGLQPITVLTVNGRVRVLRRRWYSPESGAETPLDDMILAAGETVTPGVREMCCRLNIDGANFDHVADNLYRTAQIRISGESLRKIVETEGKQVLLLHQRGLIDLGFTSADGEIELATSPAAASACGATTKSAPKTRLYVGIDGVMAPLVTDAEKRKRREKIAAKRRERLAEGASLQPLPRLRAGSDKPYKEFKAIRFYTEGNEHKHITLSRCRRTDSSQIMRRDAVRLRFQQATEKIGIVDGASWIPPQLEAADLQLDGLRLDFYHLSENVHKTRKQVYGEKSADGVSWAEQFLHMIKHNGYEAARDHLLTWRAAFRGQRRQAADRLMNYVIDRRDMINYKEFLEKGWQIGSGPTEAACKTSTSRLKRSGQKWNADNAEAVAALTNLRDSRQWDRYWPRLPKHYATKPTPAKT